MPGRGVTRGLWRGRGPGLSPGNVDGDPGDGTVLLPTRFGRRRAGIAVDLAAAPTARKGIRRRPLMPGLPPADRRRRPGGLR